LIEAASAATIEARELRKKGRSSLEQDRLVCRSLRALGIEAAAPPPVDPVGSYAEMVAGASQEAPGCALEDSPAPFRRATSLPRRASGTSGGGSSP
jgi:hypothetical protein